MAIIYGKDRETDYASGNLAPIGKSYSRMGAAPLDMYEVWYDKEALIAYASNLGTPQADGSYDTSSVLSYVGQKVAYVDEQNKKIFHYSIELDGTLKEIGNTFLEGTLIDISAANTKGEVTISHEKVAAPTVVTGTGRTYITNVETDGYGHITKIYTATETDQEIDIPAVVEGTYIDVAVNEDGDYVVSHENAPTLSITNADTDASRFITEITRDAQGHVTGYKTEKVLIPDVTLDNKSISRNDAGEIEVKGFEDADTNGLIPQIKITGEGETYSKTLEWVSVQEAIAGIEDKDTITGVKDDGKGGVTVTKQTSPDTGEHRTYVVSHKEKPTNKDDDFDVNNVATYEAKGDSGTYVTDVIIDDFGHVAGVHKASESIGKNVISKSSDGIIDDAETDKIYLNHVQGNTVTSSHKITGKNGLTVDVDKNGDLEITAPSVKIDLIEYIEPYEVESDFVYAITDQDVDADGHTIVFGKTGVPTKQYVDRLVTGATEYLGTVNSQAELDALQPKRGDFVRVATAFGQYHVSDMLVCETPYNEDNLNTPEDDTKLAVTWSVIHGEIDANTWVANTKDADGYVTKGKDDPNSVWATDEDGNPDWMVYDVDATHSTIVQRDTSGEVYGYNGDPGSEETVGQSYIDGYLKQNELISAKAIQHLAVLQVSDAEKVYVTDADGKQTQVKYSKSDISEDVIVARGTNGAITVPETPEANTDAASKKYVDDAKQAAINAIGNGKFTVSGTGYLTGSGEMTANQAGDTTASLDLTQTAKNKIDNAMPKIPDAVAGHYAMFNENGEVIDGGYIDADLSVNDTFGSMEDRPGVLGFNVYEKQTVDGVYEENPVIGYYLEVERDSGLDLYDTNLSTNNGSSANNKSRIAMGKLALSEAAKASLAKADTAIQEITSNCTNEEEDHAELNCTTSGLKITQNKDNEEKVIPGSYNIELDDSITFILNCGSAADLL